jgi:hypothetical protein
MSRAALQCRERFCNVKSSFTVAAMSRAALQCREQLYIGCNVKSGFAMSREVLQCQEQLHIGCNVTVHSLAVGDKDLKPSRAGGDRSLACGDRSPTGMCWGSVN